MERTADVTADQLVAHEPGDVLAVGDVEVLSFTHQVTLPEVSVFSLTAVWLQETPSFRWVRSYRPSGV